MATKNELKAKYKAWWSTLAPREKQMVSVGSVVVIAAVFYFGIWSPYLDRVASLRQRVQSSQKTLLWMQAADKEMKKMEGETQQQKQVTSPVVVLSDVQKQVTQSGLDGAMTQLKQASNDTVEMHFKQVPFDKLMKLLTELVKAEGVLITQMSAIASETPGIVEANVTLTLSQK